MAHGAELFHVAGYLVVVLSVGAGKLEVDDYHAVAVAHDAVGAHLLHQAIGTGVQDGALGKQLVLAREPLCGLGVGECPVYDAGDLVLLFSRSDEAALPEGADGAGGIGGCAHTGEYVVEQQALLYVVLGGDGGGVIGHGGDVPAREIRLAELDAERL